MRTRFGLLLLVLIALLIIAIGFPHGNDGWFAYWQAAPSDKQTQWVLLTEFRLPEMISALIGGAALSVAGLLLQTILNNPLAGPSVLGLTSGSHLLVALVMLGGGAYGSFLIDVSITVAAAIGSFAFGFLIIAIAMRLKSNVGLLLIGVMLGTFVSAFTSIIVANSDPSSLKAFTLWGFGSLQQLSLLQIPLFVSLFVVGILGALLLSKPLNAMVLGPDQATVLGVNISKLRWKVILVVSLLTGMVTAFCGPIGFVGLIVPNLVKMFLKTANHLRLIMYVSVFGSIVLLSCVIITRLIEPILVLPINTLMSLLGAPVVVLIMLKGKKI
jgi:iron complex transport system permease protein